MIKKVIQLKLNLKLIGITVAVDLTEPKTLMGITEYVLQKIWVEIFIDTKLVNIGHGGLIVAVTGKLFKAN